MSLADLLAARTAPTTTAACPVAELLATLDDRDAAALRSILEPNAMDTEEVMAYIRAASLFVQREHVARHKRTVRAARGLPASGLRCACPSQTI